MFNFFFCCILLNILLIFNYFQFYMDGNDFRNNLEDFKIKGEGIVSNFSGIFCIYL